MMFKGTLAWLRRRQPAQTPAPAPNVERMVTSITLDGTTLAVVEIDERDVVIETSVAAAEEHQQER